MNTSLFRLTTRFYQSTVRRMSTLSVEELAQKSTQADELIKKLRHQIEQIKIQSTDAYKAERIKKLQKENEQLKKKVEDLKAELERVEAGGKPSTTTPAAPSITRISFVLWHLFELVDFRDSTG